jgi:hypothetical protein
LIALFFDPESFARMIVGDSAARCPDRQQKLAFAQFVVCVHPLNLSRLFY